MYIYSSPAAKFMTIKVITEKVTSAFQSVCKVMYSNGVGSVVIMNWKTESIDTVGIITERDVVKLVGLLDDFNLKEPIRSFMSYPLVTGIPAMALSKVMNIMNKKNIRRLPIIDKVKGRKKLAGIITEKDIVNAIVKTHRK